MGNRANYVLIEGGQRRLYFSRWGAPVIPAVLLSGPEATIAYARALTPTTDLLDEDWAEGDVLLDCDQRIVRFFGGVGIQEKPYLRRTLLRALRRIWPGWDVNWTCFGVADLALAIGQEPASERLPETVYSTREADVRVVEDISKASGIVTVRWGDGHVTDQLLALTCMRALALGPRLLDLLRDAPGVMLPTEDAPGLPNEGVYLDTLGRQMWMSDCALFDLTHFQVLAQRWLGWQVDTHAEGLAKLVELSERDPSAIIVPDERATDELIDEIMKWNVVDPSALAVALAPKLETSRADSTVTYGMGFFSADRPPLSKEEQRALLLRLLRDTVSSNDSAAPAE